MIVPMKKITLLCLEQDKTAVLEKHPNPPM